MYNIFGSSLSRRVNMDKLAEDSGEEKDNADKKERPLSANPYKKMYSSEKKPASDKDNESDECVDDDDDDDDDEEEEDLDEIIGNSDDEREQRWRDPVTKNSRPPHPLSITHVNQTSDLQSLQKIVSAANAGDQHSEEWLQTHSIAYLKLSLKDLVEKGKIGKLSPDQQTGKVTQHIQFDAYDVNEFEYKLNLAIETYTKRIKWLLQGSKRIFGHLKGERIAICVDTSDANLGFGRQTAFQESLLHLIDEQLPDRKSIYLMSFGSDIASLWSVVRDVNYHILEEAKSWAMQHQNSGGTNLLKAMKHVLKLPDLDTVVLVLGSVPDQPSEILCDYIYQLGVGQGVVLHTVAYDCSNNLTNITLKRLAETSGGQYHCYTASCEEQIYTSTDIALLLTEIKEAQDVINKIKDMRQGLMGNALISIMNEITSEVSKLPQSRFLPRPPGHDLPLKVKVPNFHPRSSQEWLHQHGLKAKHLDLYQVLAPNAYSYREEFIPVIKKAVQSQVHEKAMIQFPWHDGSSKNLHVDMTQLFEYQKQLSEAVMLYERRVDWLASGSRRIFGTITERNVVILIDTSVSNINYLIHIQHSLRLLMEEQIANKDYFNIISFGSKTFQWKPHMVRPTEENLQDAWKFVLDLKCGGSRNFLSAFRATVENDEERKHHIFVQGIYLFTSGVPDQHYDVVTSFIEEAASGMQARLHTILFNVDDYDVNGAIPGRYANITGTAEYLRNMSHTTGGRFQWFRETGIIENDDIQYVNSEIDKALNFSRKCAMLVESVKKKYRNRYLNHPNMRVIESKSSHRHLKCIPQEEEQPKFAALPPPSNTKSENVKYADYGSSSKLLPVDRNAKPARPSSASSTGSLGTTHAPLRFRQRPSSANDPMQKVRSSSASRVTSNAKQHFFLDDPKDDTGSVFTRHSSQTKSVRKQVAHITIPDTEDSITTKEWLRIYSVSKLKLDLNRMVSGPDCKQQEKSVKILKKNITAKVYAHVFPIVNVKGTMKYMQLLPHELSEYEVQMVKVLRRYLKRLQWLLSGSRRVFGTIVHKRVAILIDTSGSMESRMEELKKELASLVWDQLHKLKIDFNIIRFSASCSVWKDSIQPPTESNCHDAIRWISQLVAGGNTCTKEALQLAFDDPDIEAIYLLTDGKPDTSTSLVLRDVTRRNEKRNISVNTISFNCSDSTANNFLRLLASETGGRYHRIHQDFDAQLFIHKLLSQGFGDSEYPHLPTFEGDDLRKLGNEIALARKFLQQSKIYKELYKTKTSNTAEKPPIGKGLTPFLTGRPKATPRTTRVE